MTVTSSASVSLTSWQSCSPSEHPLKFSACQRPWAPVSDFFYYSDNVQNTRWRPQNGWWLNVHWDPAGGDLSFQEKTMFFNYLKNIKIYSVKHTIKNTKCASENSIWVTLEQTKGLQWPVICESVNWYYTGGKGGGGVVRSWFTDLIGSETDAVHSHPTKPCSLAWAAITADWAWTSSSLWLSLHINTFLTSTAKKNQWLFSRAVCY